jgi:rod shape-determining protein MreC
MQPRRFWSPVIVVCLLLVSFIVLHRVGWTHPIEGFFLRVLSPVQASFVAWGQGIRKMTSPNVSLAQDPERIQELEDQVKNLVVENTRLRSLIDDIQLLEEQRQFLEEQFLQGVSARMISRGSDLVRQAVMINRGSRHGVKLGAAVIAEDGLLIGKVVDVFDATAQVLLLTDSSSAVAVQIQNEKQSPGIVIGEYGQALRMDLIPQNEAIEKGQRVTTSGIEPMIPKGLVVGVIRRVIDQESEVYQQAIVDPLLAYDRLRVVHVLLSGTP